MVKKSKSLRKLKIRVKIDTSEIQKFLRKHFPKRLFYSIKKEAAINIDSIINNVEVIFTVKHGPTGSEFMFYFDNESGFYTFVIKSTPFTSEDSVVEAIKNDATWIKEKPLVICPPKVESYLSNPWKTCSDYVTDDLEEIISSVKKFCENYIVSIVFLEKGDADMDFSSMVPWSKNFDPKTAAYVITPDNFDKVAKEIKESIDLPF